MQNPSAYFPGLKSQPVHDNSSFPWTRILEGAAEAIKAEFESLASRRFRPHPQNLVGKGSWGTYYLFADGERFEENCRRCPETVAALSQLPGTALAGRVFFSVIAPGTHLKAHCGATNTRLRCHLPLEIPESSCMRVAEHTLHWREGQCLVFDDSFDHEVWNPHRERSILLLDVWHPELTSAERWALGFLSRLSSRNKVYRQGIPRDPG